MLQSFRDLSKIFSNPIIQRVKRGRFDNMP